MCVMCALGVCQYVFVVIYKHVHELCVHRCAWRRYGSLEGPMDRGHSYSPLRAGG